MTDSDLIESVQAGDETALDTIYRRYLPTVWRYAFAQLSGDFAAAEDIVSETFLAAVRQVVHLKPGGGSLGAWLVAIARHKIMDLRRRRGRTHTGGQEIEMPDPRPAANPLDPLQAAETRAAVAAAMDRLPDDERQVLEWKYIEDLSVREIAHRLGRTEKAVESSLYRARNTLRQLLE